MPERLVSVYISAPKILVLSAGRTAGLMHWLATIGSAIRLDGDG